MKAILLAPTPPPAGGIAGWTVRMMEAQLKNDWSIVVVDEKAIGKRQVFGKAAKRNFFDEVKRCHSIWQGLRRELKDSEAKVVHSCIPSVTLAMMREYICAVITKKRKRKFIIHFRCTVPNTTKGVVGHFVLKRLCNKSDLIISLNQQSTEYLKTITSTPIHLIPNFISHNELVAERDVRQELKTVLYVGGLVEDKGISDCLELAKRFPDIEFRFVGKGNGEFEERAQDLNLSNAIFVGAKDRAGVKEELKNADIFLFMTYFRGEGFSNALCEAMASGLPCIVTDWAANKDMIGDSGGIVVGIRDVDSAEIAMNSIKNKNIRQIMSCANIQKVKSKYTDQVVISQYIDAYESIINEDYTQ